MSLFSAIDTSGTGVAAMQTWISTSAGNIANEDDTASTSGTVYAAQTPVFTPDPNSDTDGIGDGVQTTVVAGSNAGVVEQQPSNPLADSSGNVRVADVSSADQLVNLMAAQEGYQADTAAMSRAISAYQSGLTIGN